MRARITLAVATILAAGLASAFARQSGQTETQKNQEKVHSRLFGQGFAKRTIPEVIAGTTGDVFIRTPAAVIDIPSPLNPPPYPPYELAGIACTSDAILLGIAQSGTAHMIADQTFLYTDWAFSVQEVLKDNAKASIGNSGNVFVTRPGGELDVDGRHVHAIDDGFAAFEKGGRYLLFLQFIPETGAYRATSTEVFRLLGPKVTDLRPYPIYSGEGKGTDTLLRDTRAAVAATAANAYCAGGARRP